jgi:hypothetical protein
MFPKVASALLLAGMVGCVSVRDEHSTVVSAAGISVLSARVEDGDLEVLGRNTQDFDITATTWGTGSRRERAADREDAVTWSAVARQGRLELDGFSRQGRSGVDFDVIGPRLVSIDAIAESGTVDLDDVEGAHVITANRITGFTLGDLDVFAESDIGLMWVPYTETDALIESRGTVRLALPRGLEYDLTIRTDIDDPITVTELGWQDVRVGEGFFNGFSGRGTVEIDINTNGSVEILELR